MKRLLCCAVVLGCGDNSLPAQLTPEQAIDAVSDGTHVDVIGQVFAVSWNSTQTAARAQALVGHEDDIDWILEQDAEELRGTHTAFDDQNASYPRTEDFYVLIRTAVPDGVVQGAPGFSPSNLAAAWSLGVHLTSIDPARPLPEVGTTIEVTGTFRHVTWNQREIELPIIDDPTIATRGGGVTIAGPGQACTLDQDCNARTICDRATRTCGSPPREIYWADPWHDVNGACDTDDDCPLGQVCDPAHTIGATGPFAAHYFPTEDIGRHLCVIDPAAASVAAQCPRIYTARDLPAAGS